jgi:hypothetical protein
VAEVQTQPGQVFQRLCFSDYNFGASESPICSLEDFRAKNPSTVSIIPATTELTKFQSFEGQIGDFQMSTIHIKDQAVFPDLEKEESNLLAGYAYFRMCFDGMLTGAGGPEELFPVVKVCVCAMELFS